MLQTLSRSNPFFKIGFVFLFAAASLGCTVSARSDSAQVDSAAARAAQNPLQTPVGTPSATVKEFYRALGERRFREAILMTNWRPAVEPLTAQELEDLRPDFEPLAAQAGGVAVAGEQLSGELATVFVKAKDSETGASSDDKVELRRENGGWIIVMGDKETEEAVRREGKNYFFNQRLEIRHAGVQLIMQDIVKAQLVYSLQNNNVFADLPVLVNAKILSSDVLGIETGYRFRLQFSGDKKKYTVNAEPVEYGRTGKLSFLLESNGGSGGSPRVQSADKKGQPLDGKK